MAINVLLIDGASFSFWSHFEAPWTEGIPSISVPHHLSLSKQKFPHSGQQHAQAACEYNNL